MALRTPSSQKLSLMLALVDVRSKKKARIRAIILTITEKRLNRDSDESREALKSRMSKTKLTSSLKKALMPFAMKSLLYIGMFSASFTKRKSFGMPL